MEAFGHDGHFFHPSAAIYRTLHLAAANKDVGKLQELLEDPNLVGLNGKSRLNIDDKGEGIGKHDSLTALQRALHPAHGAASANTAKVVQMLIDWGADVNQQDKDGMTVLMFACKHYADKSGNPAASVKALLAAGADVNQQNQQDKGKTALFYACMEGAADTVKLLLADGANYNLEDRHGYTVCFHLERVNPGAYRASDKQACLKLVESWRHAINEDQEEAKAAEWKAEVDWKLHPIRSFFSGICSWVSARL